MLCALKVHKKVVGSNKIKSNVKKIKEIKIKIVKFVQAKDITKLNPNITNEIKQQLR